MKVAHHPAIGKGQAEVVIGTTKPLSAMLIDRLEGRRDSIGAVRDAPEPAFVESTKVRPRSHSICARSGVHPVRVLAHKFSDQLTAPSSMSHRTLSMMSIRDFEESLESVCPD